MCAGQGKMCHSADNYQNPDLDQAKRTIYRAKHYSTASSSRARPKPEAQMAFTASPTSKMQSPKSYSPVENPSMQSFRITSVARDPIQRPAEWAVSWSMSKAPSKATTSESIRRTASRMSKHCPPTMTTARSRSQTALHPSSAHSHSASP